MVSKVVNSAEERRLSALSELACLVADGAATTRSALIAATGLSRSAVAQRVDLLIERGLLVESEPLTTDRGRPPYALELASQEAAVVGVDLGATHSRIALTTLGGRVLAEAAREIDINEGPDRILGGVGELIEELCRTALLTPASLRAIGIGVPGPVEAESGTVVRPPIMQGWDGYRVPAFFERGYAAPVLVDNDVNMMAFGEYVHRRESEHLLYVKVGTGIGCGIVSGGVLHRGASGAAGDIGHIRDRKSVV